MKDPASQISLAAVPLFPLPNVVLLPRAVLPLHIFEERYKQMTADALRTEKLIAMALLRPGWEKDYYQAPAIEPIVCVGNILSHEKLPDGRYNFLLQGLLRARVRREIRKHPYRVAELEPVAELSVDDSELTGYRHELAGLFGNGPLSRTSVGRQFSEVLASPMPTTDVADLVAFNLVEDLRLKQTLLADGDPRRRVATVVQAVRQLVPLVAAAAQRDGEQPSLN